MFEGVQQKLGKTAKNVTATNEVILHDPLAFNWRVWKGTGLTNTVMSLAVISISGLH